MSGMTLLILEAFGALVIFVAIVWWVMFAGRRRGERRGADERGGPRRRDDGRHS